MNSTDPSARVIESVAEAAGVPPEDLSPPLYETIDPDALDSLVTSTSTDVAVSFEFNGYDVEVNANGSVSVALRTDEE